MRDQACVIMLESFHSQQKMEEHSEFIHNSQKISIYASVMLIRISYSLSIYIKKINNFVDWLFTAKLAQQHTEL